MIIFYSIDYVYIIFIHGYYFLFIDIIFIQILSRSLALAPYFMCAHLTLEHVTIGHVSADIQLYYFMCITIICHIRIILIYNY